MKYYWQQLWNKPLALSLLMGILLGFSFPPFPFPFLAFPAFIILFRIIELADSSRAAAYHTYPGFVLWNLITTYWLMMATLPAGIAAILANAALMTLPVMLQRILQQRLKNGWLTAFLQAGFWVGYEYIFHFWKLAWPWLSLGNAWADMPSLVQYISATGYLGISFWIVFTAALAYQALRGANTNYAWYALAVCFLFPAISLIQLSFVDTQGEHKIEAAVVQPNFDSYLEYGGFGSPKKAMDHLFELSDSVITKKTDLVLWPENGIYPYIISRSGLNRTADKLKQRILNYASANNVTIIAGTTYYEYYSEGQAPPLAHQSPRGPWLPYNAGLAFHPDKTIEVYRKHNLVPIVERVPYVRFLKAIDIFGWVDWVDIQGYGQGKKANPLKVDDTSTPALVCYDSVFPAWVRGFVEHGAGFLSVITNDGWWGDTSGHRQHFAYARLRAVEFRRWVVRSANNGISGVIASDGSVKIEIPYGKTAAFSAAIPVKTELTFYTRYGGWLPQLLLACSVIGLFVSLFLPNSSSD